MSYEEQREWELTDRQHRQEIENCEYDAERQRQDAATSARLSALRISSLRIEVDELAEEAGVAARQLAETVRALAAAEAFIRLRGLWDEFQAATHSPTSEVSHDDDC